MSIYLKKSCKIAHFLNSTFLYIEQLVTCTMSHSYFREPTGVFKTLLGSSMGDCSAAHVSEIILCTSEFNIWKKLFYQKLNLNILWCLRFCDDVSVHIAGSPQKITYALKIIITAYPKEIQFNVATNLIWGKFLNIRIFNDLSSSSPYTSVLRKTNFKFRKIQIPTTIIN